MTTWSCLKIGHQNIRWLKASPSRLQFRDIHHFLGKTILSKTAQLHIYVSFPNQPFVSICYVGLLHREKQPRISDSLRFQVFISISLSISIYISTSIAISITVPLLSVFDSVDGPSCSPCAFPTGDVGRSHGRGQHRIQRPQQQLRKIVVVGSGVSCIGADGPGPVAG